MQYWNQVPLDHQLFTKIANQLGAPTIHIIQGNIQCNNDKQYYQLKKKGFEIYGLIYAYKWTKCIEKREASPDYCEDLFFARQIDHNACPTQTIVSVLLNAPIVLEGHLESFYNFAKYLNCEDRGLALSNSKAIRKVHNNIHQKDKDESESSVSEPSEADNYHYVAFIPYKGTLCELDGLQAGPILIDKVEKEKWHERATEELLKRKNASNVKSCKSMVVCEDIQLRQERQLQKLRSELLHCQNITRREEIQLLIKQKEMLIKSIKLQGKE